MPDTGTGLPAAAVLYREYGSRARELKAGGQRFMGYLCAFVPVEIITAAGLIPFRIKGDASEPITKADADMETIICPLVRSCFDMVIKGKYEFIEGAVIPHACDSMCRTYEVWQGATGLAYTHLLNTPHGTDDSSLDYFKAEVNTLRQSLGKYAGKTITDEGLKQAIKLHNEERAQVADLYRLRRSEPPLISGVELARVLIAAMSLPAEEATQLIKGVIAEVKDRKITAAPKPRMMLVGAQVDNTGIIELIEQSGAAIVADDLCPGARESLEPVKETADPVDGLAERYLRGVYCSRSYRPRRGSYEDYLEERFGHIGRAIKEFKVDGVILYIYKYCDPFGFEVPQIKSYIESKGVPAIYIEDEYSLSGMGRLSTRVQAFLELLGSK
jgi:bcr-type benzoyl-CoA reductase subunit C